jgi:tryptophanyl-tRNA synthetase
MTEQETIEKIKTAYTDPTRRYRSDPGHPDKCNVYKLMSYFESIARSGIAEKCRKAEIGCVDCKMILADVINKALKPIRQRRSKLAANPDYIATVLADGADSARIIAQKTLTEVKKNMRLI